MASGCESGERGLGLLPVHLGVDEGVDGIGVGFVVAIREGLPLLSSVNLPP